MGDDTKDSLCFVDKFLKDEELYVKWTFRRVDFGLLTCISFTY